MSGNRENIRSRRPKRESKADALRSRRLSRRLHFESLESRWLLAADLWLTKIGSPSPVLAGETVTYTFSVTNLGPDEAVGVVVANTLPAGTSLVASGGCAEDPLGQPVCSLGNVGAGASASATITLAVDSNVPAGTVLRNAALVSSSTGDPDPINNVAFEEILVQRAANLALSKTESADPVTPGGTLTYQVVLTNNGPSDASGIALAESITLPTGVAIVSISPGVGTSYSPPAAANGTWTVGTLPAGSSATLTVVLNVGAATSPGVDVIGDTVTLLTINEPNSGDTSVTERTSVAPGPPPPVQIVNDSDPEATFTGPWVYLGNCLGFFENDVTYVAGDVGGSAAATGSFVFSGLIPGDYRVSATWRTVPQYVQYRATDAPFTVSGGDFPVTVQVDQTLNPGDYANSFVDQGAYWMDLVPSYAVVGTTLTVTLSNDADNYVVADAIRIERLSAGAVPFSAPSPVPSPTGDATLQIIDDGDAGYRSGCCWVTFDGIGHQSDVRYHASGSGSGRSLWTFRGLTPGASYEIAATWAPHANRATNAPYRIYDGSDSIGIVLAATTADQQAAPDDFQDQGNWWEILARVVPTGDMITVELNDAADGFVIADAIRLQQTAAPEGEAGFRSARYTNPENRFDVNGDGALTPVDLLSMINDQNASGPRALPPRVIDAAPYLDVNGDGRASTLDIIMALNTLNGAEFVTSSRAAEGEAAILPFGYIDSDTPADALVQPADVPLVRIVSSDSPTRDAAIPRTLPDDSLRTLYDAADNAERELPAPTREEPGDDRESWWESIAEELAGVLDGH
ncbi:MAG: DUF11 domain-containing protein [Pirellulaceae bacterium]|nr:DUF11 domain-containing protein [Pirellulaceae bacterium]